MIAVGEEFIEGDKVGVSEVSEGAEFAFEPVERGSVGDAQELQGDGGATLAVECLVHNTEPALTETAAELEPRSPSEFLHGSRANVSLFG